MYTSTIIRTLAAVVLGILSALLPSAISAQSAPSAPDAQLYSIMIWESPAQLALRTDPVHGATYWAAFAKIGEELQRAGVLRGGTALRTGDEVRTVTVRNGNPQVRHVAHVRAREDLGGYFIIEVASLDEALRWAARIPTAITGAIEVRPAYPAPTMTK